MPDANTLAPLALFAWIPVTLALFALQRPELAASIALIGAGLLLPSGYAIQIEGAPELSRDTIATLAALGGVLLFHRRRLALRPPLRGAEWLVVLMVLGGVATALTNTDARDIGVRTLPPVPLWSTVSRTADALLVFGIPFYLGRVLFRRPSDLTVLFSVLALAGVLYSLPIVWEARMSPQLHYRLYGYMPAEFSMAKRELFFGWRPMVFVGHGLSLAMFVATAAVAGSVLYRAGSRLLGGLARFLPIYLYFVLLLCNSLAAIVYGTLAVPFAALARMRLQRLAVVGLAALVLLYPALRAPNLFPTETLVGAARNLSENRADSLAFRFENENLLLEHVRKRILFGWGGYGRDRAYDPQTGRDISTTDGYWIIVLGQNGVVGFIAAFGMLLIPIFSAFRTTRRRPTGRAAMLVVGAAWVVALNAVDLLPNGFLSARMLFFAGALAGSVEGWRPARRVRTREPREGPAPRSSRVSARGAPPQSLAEGLRRRVGTSPDRRRAEGGAGSHSP